MELGLMKQIVKILIKDVDYFAYVCATFLGLSNKKTTQLAFSMVLNSITDPK